MTVVTLVYLFFSFTLGMDVMMGTPLYLREAPRRLLCWQDFMFTTSRRDHISVWFMVLDMMVTLLAMQFERFFRGFNLQICMSPILS
jgi:hypothetical protein